MYSVEETVESYTEQIHDQDEDRFKDLFTRDAVLISGTKLFSGVEEIYREFVRNLLHAKFTEISLVKENLTVRYVTEEVAVAVFQYHTECILRKNGNSYGIAGIETQVLKKQGESWKIVHIQYALL